MLLTHEMLADIDLYQDQLDALRELIPQESFTAREAVDAHIAAGHEWTDIPRAYQAIVNAGKLPDVGLIWKVARIAFREQPERNAHLRRWAGTLGPDNWHDARSEAIVAYDDDDAYAYAAYAAYAAAYAAAAYAAADDYAGAAACAANAYATDAFERVKQEILDMIVEEIERN